MRRNRRCIICSGSIKLPMRFPNRPRGYLWATWRILFAPPVLWWTLCLVDRGSAFPRIICEA